MPAPDENSASPSVTTVWPPPPTSAPETFVVEGVTVTKRGELLTVNNPQAGRTTILGILFQATIFAVFYGLSVKGWVYVHNTIGPKVALWSDPFFIYRLQDLSATYFFIILIFSSIHCWMFVSLYGSGKTTFNRSTKSMQIGRQFYHVRSVFVRRQPYIIRSVFVLSFRIDQVKKFPRPFRVLFYNFRHRESAQKLAEDVAAFLGVPVEE